MKEQDRFIIAVRWFGIALVVYILCMTVLEILGKV